MGYVKKGYKLSRDTEIGRLYCDEHMTKDDISAKFNITVKAVNSSISKYQKGLGYRHTYKTRKNVEKIDELMSIANDKAMYALMRVLDGYDVHGNKLNLQDPDILKPWLALVKMLPMEFSGLRMPVKVQTSSINIKSEDFKIFNAIADRKYIDVTAEPPQDAPRVN